MQSQFNRANSGKLAIERLERETERERERKRITMIERKEDFSLFIDIKMNS